MEELRTRKKMKQVKNKNKTHITFKLFLKIAIPKQSTKQARGLIFPDFKTYYKASN